MKKVIIRISDALCHQISKDLSRSHGYACERVGFAFGNSKVLPGNYELIIINDYLPVEDTHYIKDDSVGARINSDAIRNAMQVAMDRKCSVFHIHEHIGNGTPSFSATDLEELPGVAKSMVNANAASTHGLLLLSQDGINAAVFSKPSKEEVHLEKVVRVGYPLNFNANWFKTARFDKDRYNRQSFLGNWSQHKLSKIKVGIVGLGGGGSHIAQQLAHLGVQHYAIFDSDFIEESNLNRLVGGTLDDTNEKITKTEIARRLIHGLQREANVIIKGQWEDNSSYLQSCDIVFGAVDSFLGRRDLEQECRRYFIPYIDIGIDVRIIKTDPPRLYGQVILSMPGKPCMHCIGFLNDELLAQEAARYGDAGNKPQVIWSNGVVASNAIGVFVDLVTGWTNGKDMAYYQEYDGNKVVLSKSYRLEYLKTEECQHYLIKDAGPINWANIKNS